MKIKLTKLCDSIHPVDQEAMNWLLNLGEGEIVTLEITDRNASEAQQRAKWVYCDQLAKSLNAAGYDMKLFPWKDGYFLDWSKESVAKLLWGPVADALFGIERTKQLTTKEVQEVYQNVDRAVAMKTGVSVPFPKRDI